MRTHPPTVIFVLFRFCFVCFFRMADLGNVNADYKWLQLRKIPYKDRKGQVCIWESCDRKTRKGSLFFDVYRSQKSGDIDGVTIVTTLHSKGRGNKIALLLQVIYIQNHASRRCTKIVSIFFFLPDLHDAHHFFLFFPRICFSRFLKCANMHLLSLSNFSIAHTYS